MYSPTFCRDPVEAIKRGGDLLLACGIGKQIASQLLEGKFIEWLVVPERLQNVVTIWPYWPSVVTMETSRVRITDSIELMQRLRLGIAG